MMYHTVHTFNRRKLLLLFYFSQIYSDKQIHSVSQTYTTFVKMQQEYKRIAKSVKKGSKLERMVVKSSQGLQQTSRNSSWGHTVRSLC